jgi:hypothetical protein
MPDERIDPETQHEIIMAMVYQACEALVPDDGSWLPTATQQQIEAISHRLRYALALDTPLNGQATPGSPAEIHST